MIANPIQSNQVVSAAGGSSSFQTLVFSNSNGVSFSNSNGSIVASHNALTSQSNQAFSAYGGSSTFQTLSFSNANGISFSNSDGQVQASYTVPSTAGLLSNINVSAGTTSQNLSAFVFSNSNNISFGLSGSTVTASATVASTQGSINFSAGATSNIGSVFVFSNSNNVSFGLNGSTVTATITVPAQTVQPGIQSIQVSDTTYTSGKVIFSNANGASFGSSAGSVVTLSYTVPTVTNSSWTVSDAATSGTVGRLAFTNLNGVTLSLSSGTAGLHTIVGSHNAITSQSNQNVSLFGLGNTTQNSSTVLNASNLSFNAIGSLTVGFSNGSIQLSAPNALTVQSNQNLSLYALGNTTQNSSTVLNASVLSFNAIGSITMGFSNGSLQVSAPNALTSQSNQAFSADASSTFQTLSFQNSNGVSFSNNAGALRITHDLQFTSNTSNITANALNTSASRVINIIAATNNTGGGTASLSSNVSFSNANGATFYTSAGNAIALSYTVPTVTNSSFSVQDSATTINPVNRIAFSTGNNITLSLSTGASSATVGVQHNLAGTSTGFGGNLLSASMTHNSSGLNLSLNHPAWLTTAALSGDTTKYIQEWALTGNTAGTTSSAQGTRLYFSGGNNITISGSSNTIVLSAGGGTTNQTGPNIADGNGNTITSGTVVFSNSNNHSFGLNGSTMTGSSPVSFSAGTTNNNLTNIVFSNSNGASFGLNGSTITVDARNILSTYEPYPAYGLSTVLVGVPTGTSAGISVYPFVIEEYVSAGIMNVAYSMAFLTVGTSSGRQTAGLAMAIYSRNVSTLSSIVSTSFSWVVTGNNSSYSIDQVTSTGYAGYGATGQTNSAGSNISSGYTGIKLIGFPINTLLSPGNYWMAMIGTNSTTSNNVGISLSHIGAAMATGYSAMAPMGSYSSAFTAGQDPRGGRWNVGQGSWTSVGSVTMVPVSMNMNSISAVGLTYPIVKFWST